MIFYLTDIGTFYLITVYEGSDFYRNFLIDNTFLLMYFLLINIVTFILYIISY